MSEHYDTIFGGVKRLYGADKVGFIKNAHVAVVGLGGVGSWAVESLVRSGIGAVTIIDGDKICPTNTNRQIHTHSASIGRPKADEMCDRITLINPSLSVTPIVEYITAQTIDYLPVDLDFVIDAVDSVRDKAAMINFCSRNKIPIICAGGAAGKTDPTTIEVKDLRRIENDPLLAKVRSFLRRHYGYSKNIKHRFGVRCVFSHQQIFYPQVDGSVKRQRAQDNGVLLSKIKSDGLGASVCMTATFGMVAAAFVIQKIIEKGERDLVSNKDAGG